MYQVVFTYGHTHTNTDMYVHTQRHLCVTHIHVLAHTDKYRSGLTSQPRERQKNLNKAYMQLNLSRTLLISLSLLLTLINIIQYRWLKRCLYWRIQAAVCLMNMEYLTVDI